MKARAYEVLDFCLDEVVALTQKPLSAESDRAYVYIDMKKKDYSWVIFAHGAMGTFQKRSPHYGAVFSCGVQNGPPMKVVFLGAPLKDTLINELSPNYVATPEGATEFLFKREGEKFEYCCSQPFDENNFDKHEADSSR